MAHFELPVKARTKSGKEASKQSRRAGEIPVVLYGHQEAPKTFTVNTRQFNDLVLHHGTKSLLVLSGDGGQETAFIKHIQKNYAKGTVNSVDLIRVSRDEKITVAVPVILDGETAEVKSGDGVLVQGTLTVEVTARPEDIPEAIHADVSGLELDGAALHASDLTMPAGVELVSGDETAIAAVNYVKEDEGAGDVPLEVEDHNAASNVDAEFGGPNGAGEGLKSGHNNATTGKEDGVEHN